MKSKTSIFVLLKTFLSLLSALSLSALLASCKTTTKEQSKAEPQPTEGFIAIDEGQEEIVPDNPGFELPAAEADELIINGSMEAETPKRPIAETPESQKENDLGLVGMDNLNENCGELCVRDQQIGPSLRVSSNVRGASVAIDGILAGSTGELIDAQVGEMEVIVFADGYKESKVKVIINNAATKEIEVLLEKAAEGKAVQ